VPSSDFADAAPAQPEVISGHYHVVARANNVVDEVRRAEPRARPELRRSRYVWLK
jgi:hypothetical protein